MGQLLARLVAVGHGRGFKSSTWGSQVGHRTVGIQMHLVKQPVTITSTSLTCAMARQSTLTKSLLYYLKERGINCNFYTTLVSRAHISKLGSWRGLGLVRGLSSAAGFALGYFTPSKCHDLFLALLVLSALLALTGSHFHPLLLPCL